MADDKPELSSHELIRQAREALAPPTPKTPASAQLSTSVDGPTIQELLAKPLSSDSLLPQRAVDPWAEDEADSIDEAWEPLQRDVPPAPPSAPEARVRKRRRVPAAESLFPRLSPGQPPAPQTMPQLPPQWQESMGDERGLPPAPPTAMPPRPASRPLRSPAQQSRRSGFPWRLIIVGFLGISILIGSFVDDSSMTEIELGSCYDSTNFATANVVACAQPHRVQVFALLDRSLNTTQAGNRCFDEAIALRDSGSIPSSTIFPDGTFVGAAEQSTSGDTTYCYFESPSNGLVGSVLPE